MLRRIQPAKIICYSQPFPEMEGEIIPVDYELSSWKYQNKSQEILHTQPSRGMIVTKTILQPDELFQIVWKAPAVPMAVNGSQKSREMKNS